MAIKEIYYDVDAQGISPATEQPGGVQGDHRVTEVRFRLSAGLRAAIARVTAEGGYAVSRFDVYDGSGGLFRTAPVQLSGDDSPLCYRLEYRNTRYGGQVRVWLVISVVNEAGKDTELYSFPAVLRLRDQPRRPHLEGEYRSLSSLAESARNSAAAAEAARDRAEEAQGKTEDAQRALESGSDFVFDGGWAKGSLWVDFAVDDALSATSENPVQNRRVYEALEEMRGTLPGMISDEVAAQTADLATNTQLSALRAEIFGMMYPVGSVFITFNSDDYSDYLGFRWERTAVGKTLLGVDPDDAAFAAAGYTGGEKQHTLTTAEMPSHQHAMELTRAGFKDFAVPVSSGEYKLPLSMDIGVNAHWFTESVRAAASGGGQPHNNLPPYITVYIWRRIKNEEEA